jgi:hypothetical protein
MPVFFGRDINRFTHFISTWYGESPMLRAPSTVSSSVRSRRRLQKTAFDSLQCPVQIFYPLDYLPTVNPRQSQLIETFVQGLEKALNVKRTEVSLARKWEAECPAGPQHSDIAEYLYLVHMTLSLTELPLTIYRLVRIRIITIRIAISKRSETSTDPSTVRLRSSSMQCDGNGMWQRHHSIPDRSLLTSNA